MERGSRVGGPLSSVSTAQIHVRGLSMFFWRVVGSVYLLISTRNFIRLQRHLLHSQDEFCISQIMQHLLNQHFSSLRILPATQKN